MQVCKSSFAVSHHRPSFVPASRRLLILAGVAAALSLSGCGRRGPLEPPPGSAQAKQAEDRKAASEASGNPLMQGGTRRPPPIQRPKEPFILDPLLD